MNGVCMSTVYHYCDLNAFLSIIKNKKLWLSCIDNMNDRTEVLHFRSALFKKMDLICNDANKDILNIFHQLLERQFPKPYICCFSRNGDVLSQWRAYAADGCGISIGFELNSFNFNDNSPFMSLNKKDSIGSSAVRYMTDSEINSEIDKILSLIFQAKEFNDSDRFLKLNEIVHLVRRCCLFTKNSYFSEEEEVRVAHLPMLMTNMDGAHINACSISDIMHRVVRNRIASYFELDFADLVSPIKNIILGPKCEVTEYELGLFLNMYGQSKIPITRSGASYR